MQRAAVLQMPLGENAERTARFEKRGAAANCINIAGGAVNSDAPRAAVYALCFADPFAWMAADAVLLVPFLRNIMKMDYRYLKGTM